MYAMRDRSSNASGRGGLRRSLVRWFCFAAAFGPAAAPGQPGPLAQTNPAESPPVRYTWGASYRQILENSGGATLAAVPGERLTVRIGAVRVTYCFYTRERIKTVLLRPQPPDPAVPPRETAPRETPERAPLQQFDRVEFEPDGDPLESPLYAVHWEVPLLPADLDGHDPILERLRAEYPRLQRSPDRWTLSDETTDLTLVFLRRNDRNYLTHAAFQGRELTRQRNRERARFQTEVDRAIRRAVDAANRAARRAENKN